jgi:hypothetical protein
MRLGHANGNVTTVGFPYEPDHDDLQVLRDADHEALNDLSRTMRSWLLSLPEEHQPYWTHIMQIDHLWPTHGDAPPVWVSCPAHPDLERAVADHFSGRGHECVVLPAEAADVVPELTEEG